MTTESQYSELVEAVDAMGAQLVSIDTDDVYGSLTCSNINSIAEVLRITGNGDVADFIIAEHARHDDEGDEHYTPIKINVGDVVYLPGKRESNILVHFGDTDGIEMYGIVRGQRGWRPVKEAADLVQREGWVKDEDHDHS